MGISQKYAETRDYRDSMGDGSKYRGWFFALALTVNAYVVIANLALGGGSEAVSSRWAFNVVDYHEDDSKRAGRRRKLLASQRRRVIDR